MLKKINSLFDKPKVIGENEKINVPITSVFLVPIFGTIILPAICDAINWTIEKYISRNPIVLFEKSNFSIIHGKCETVLPQIKTGTKIDIDAEKKLFKYNEILVI